jgi:C-terminal processing protease CtpA/Prc
MFPLSRMSRNRLVGLGLVLTIFARASSGSANGQGPANLDFEQGTVGKLPNGWTLTDSAAKKGFMAVLSDDKPKSGQRCALISRAPKSKDVRVGMADLGSLTQGLDAAPFRGKRVRFRVAARIEPQGLYSWGQAVVRVSAKGALPSFYDDLADRPIMHKEWRDYEILAEVAGDADRIELELVLRGHGKAWFDDVRVEAIGKAGDGNEPARPVAGRGLDNLVALARLVGYVRYFHPSDQAAATDWDAFTIRGVRAVEPAKGPEELATALDKLFRPIAPTLRVYPTGTDPTDPPNLVPPGDKSAFKVVYWHHYGIGTGNPISIYVSERVGGNNSVRLSAKEGNDRASAAFKTAKVAPPDPAKPFDAELGGGVGCRLPLALYGDAQGTMPRGDAAIKVADGRPAGFFPTGNDRATRLAAVMLAWNVFQHFYPYFDVVKTDWPAALRQALQSAAADTDQRAFLITLRRLVAALHDGHGRVYLGGLRYQESHRPPVQWEWVEDQLVIIHAAAAAGVSAGDVVAKIDGQPAAKVIAQREELVSSATPQYRRYVALLELAMGAPDSELIVEIVSPEGKSRVVTLRRTVRFAEFEEKRPQKITELKKGIWYVDIDRVTDDELQTAMPKLAEATGIVFDLRGYPRQGGFNIPSHLTDKPVNSGQWHIPMVAYPDRQNMEFSFSDWKLPPVAPRFKAKVAFVTDGRAISAAETLLGIVEQHRLADIVGSPTAGTNGNVNPFTVPGGYRITWTGMKVLKQDGSQHHGVAIVPTVPATRTLRGVAEGRDEPLERALALVSAQGKE